MEQFDEREDRNALRRLRCIRQIADADEETLGIVSSVLDRAAGEAGAEETRAAAAR